MPHPSTLHDPPGCRSHPIRSQDRKDKQIRLNIHLIQHNRQVWRAWAYHSFQTRDTSAIAARQIDRTGYTKYGVYSRAVHTNDILGPTTPYHIILSQRLSCIQTDAWRWADKLIAEDIFISTSLTWAPACICMHAGVQDDKVDACVGDAGGGIIRRLLDLSEFLLSCHITCFLCFVEWDKSMYICTYVPLCFKHPPLTGLWSIDQSR